MRFMASVSSIKKRIRPLLGEDNGILLGFSCIIKELVGRKVRKK